MLELAGEYSAGIRLVMAQENEDSLADLPTEILTPIQEYAPRLLGQFKPKTPDVFHASCHPGYADAALLAGSSYARQRESELGVLTDPEVRLAIKARGIELISFAEL